MVTWTWRSGMPLMTTLPSLMLLRMMIDKLQHGDVDMAQWNAFDDYPAIIDAFKNDDR